MEFLKEILGEELFNQVNEKVNAYNEDEGNKDSQIKLANLGTGEYVGKGKFEGLQEQLNGKNTELESANELISELKKSTKGNDELQSKISEYAATTEKLQAELKETKLKSAVKVALMGENAKEIDFLTFKLKEKLAEDGSTLELDENDNIKGWKDIAEGLKTQNPTFFESENAEDKKILENKLKTGEPEAKSDPKSLSEALKMQYEKTETE